MSKLLLSLQHSILFKGLTIVDLNNALLQINYSIKEFKKGSFVLRVDQEARQIGIVLEGLVEVQKILRSGKSISIVIKELGAVFGEGSVFSKTPTYPCNVLAKKDSSVMFITKLNLLKLLSSNTKILENFLTSFGNNALSLNLKTELLSYSSIQQKISFSLLHILNEHNISNVINLPYSKKTWAELLNVSRPSLFRELSKLQQNNIIEINNKVIKIINKHKLQELLQQ